jgi:hypothetical protein
VSYDLQVFAQQPLSADDLRRLVAEAGLTLDEVGDAAGSLTVLRGAKARYSFTLGMPVAVEPEDVPEEITAVLLAPSFLYELMVEGSSTAETPHVVRFARRLAEASSGVVLDQQSGHTWVRGKLRTSAPVQRGTIDIVELRWYTRTDDSGRSAATSWLELARRHLPEALPRRFGLVEPLAMKLDVDGPDAFVRAVATEDMSVFFAASAPCISGHVAGEAGTQDVHSHALSVHREPLRDARWRDALQRLFVEFAISTSAVFASAEVQRGLVWSGRSIWFNASAERTTHLAARGRWAGLLPYPAWWTWFGPHYIPLVVDHLPADQVKAFSTGLFHARGADPLDRDQLTATPPTTAGGGEPRRGLLRLLSRQEKKPPRGLARTWLPAELLATVDASDPHLYNPPLIPAMTMPPGLRA